MKTILLSLLLLAGAIALVNAQSYRKAIFYHHSSGGCFYDRQNLYDNSTPSSVPTVPKEIAKYNAVHGFSVNTAVSMSEQWMPGNPTGNNWRDWASTFAGGMSYGTPVIIIKTCYLQQQTMHSSGDIETLKGYYRALVREMAKHPANFFVIWNNMPAPTDGLSDRAVWSAQFSAWCKDVLAKGNDSFGVFPANVYVFDVFRKLADPITGYCDPKYGNPGDDHPSSASVTLVTPQFVKEVFDAALAYEKLTAIDPAERNVPSRYQLNQNYPNPFNPATEISYQVATAVHVSLRVFDITGRDIATLVDSEQQPGTYRVSFDAKNLSSGLYMYQLHAGTFTNAKKMTLIR
jgi:hypothetical protein